MARAKPFSQLPKFINQRKKNIDPAISRIMKKVAKVGHTALILGTPVDIGTARSNWVMTKDTPNRTPIPAYAPGEKLGIGERANASAAIGQGETALSTFSLGANRSIFITNFIRYISFLNGPPFHSKQTPGKFVEKAFQLMRSIVKSERLNLAKKRGF